MSIGPTQRCHRCGTEVPGRGWREVIGWEQGRNDGGTNHVALRKQTGRVMCAGCMHLAKSGIAFDQQRIA